MYCPNCGRNVNDTAKFCPGCGTPLTGFEQQNQTVLLMPEPAAESSMKGQTQELIPQEPTTVVFMEQSGEITDARSVQPDLQMQEAVSGFMVEREIMSGAVEETPENVQQVPIGIAAQSVTPEPILGEEKITKKTKKPKKEKKNKKKSKGWLILVFLLIAGLTVAAVLFGVSKAIEAKKVEKQLTLGEKYLWELEYEQAIAAYEKAIKIDPKNTDAYLGLADVYIEMGDLDKGEEVLKEAKENITKKEDKERIKWKENKIEKSREDREDREVTPVPEKMPTSTLTPTSSLAPTLTPTLSPILSPTKTPTKAPSSNKVEELKNAAVGDYITFGTYEQDNNLSNGAEPIEWLILDKKDGMALVLSKYALDAKPYNEEWVDVTWETCTLRNWLNEEFYTTAFNKTECSAVMQTLINHKDNPEHETEGGNDTRDKVFLLSIEEVTTYFGPVLNSFDPARRVQVTEYAKAQKGDYSLKDEYYSNGWWWLRSPGGNNSNAAEVDSDGYVDMNGSFVTNYNNVVRPAMWIAYEEQETVTPDVTPTLTPATGKADVLQNAAVGDYITFGAFEQDNNLDNGAEPIEWLVLDKKDGKALVLSKYALVSKKYNDEWTSITWEGSSIRRWLNNEFYTTAFDTKERSAVVESLNINVNNPESGTYGGHDTRDKVFLLSIEEVNAYFDPDPDVPDMNLYAKVTEYAKAQNGFAYDEAFWGIYDTTEYDGNGDWWLRSPGDNTYCAMVVGMLGFVDIAGTGASSLGKVVRPAMWVQY